MSFRSSVDLAIVSTQQSTFQMSFFAALLLAHFTAYKVSTPGAFWSAFQLANGPAHLHPDMAALISANHDTFRSTL
jgi:hypothetical protein